MFVLDYRILLRAERTGVLAIALTHYKCGTVKLYED